MTLEELGSKLAKLEETCRIAEEELAALGIRVERVRELEADRDALIASYAEMVPEALDALSGEDRMRVYELLQLEVEPDTKGCEVSGLLCSRRPRGRGRYESTKPIELRFHALLTEGDSRVHFHRKGFDRLKEDLGQGQRWPLDTQSPTTPGRRRLTHPYTGGAMQDAPRSGK